MDRSLQAAHVAVLVLCETIERIQDVHCRLTVDGVEISLCSPAPLDPP
ncbi:MAG TPA: hypothetical protein VGL99_01705 [Chloroflexota bacterium]